MNDLQKRLFEFSIDTIRLLKSLPQTVEFKVIRYQLTKSATSCGANYEEAQAASSKADFNYKTSIALREMRESNYWLRILEELTDENQQKEKLIKFVKESEELKSILGAIVSKTQKDK